MGMKSKKMMKKWILPTVKRGVALSFLLILGALESLLGGAASVAKAINNSKAARRQLEELQCYDRAMEQGCGLYLAPHKYGRGQIRTQPLQTRTECNCKEKKMPKRR